MEQLYSQMFNLCDTLCGKMHLHGLCESEQILYEKLCTSLAKYVTGLGFAFEIMTMNTEMDLAKFEEKYLVWVSETEKAAVEKDREEKKLEEERRQKEDT